MGIAVSKSKSRKAYHKLRELILSGGLRSGERLTQARAAAILGMSIAPVRNSILRLEAEGLLARRGNGCIPTVLYAEDEDLKELVQRYELRGAIEAEAARLAALNMSGRQIAKLRDLAKKLDALLIASPSKLETTWKVHENFHHFLMSNCGNDLLYRVWRNNRLTPISIRTSNFRRKLKELEPQQRPPVPEKMFMHLAELISNHDAEGARRDMESRIGGITEALRRILEQKERV